ncbi:MAG TPA: hypothetical protein VJ828_12605 [Lacipirellulaceae bacterium]|nr:hypothetical protein [Lacipirellulaceae bacterium]
MKNSWRKLFRRLAVAGAISGATVGSSAMCFAVQLAHDVATDAVYDDGWTAGDNGGTGFGPWNFDGTYTTPPPDQQRMDDGLKTGGPNSSIFNDIGESWTLFNKEFLGNNKDISQAGRSIPALQVGQTISIVFDNPTERMFFRGYTIRFNNGGASSCWEADNCTTPDFDPGSIVPRLSVGTFDYLSTADDGRWYPFEPTPGHYDTETDQGARLDFTLTDPETYQLTMTPLGHEPGQPMPPPFSKTGNLEPGENNEHVGKTIDWIEFEFYNTLNDPGGCCDTDFFIRSMEITGPAAGLDGDFNGDGSVDAADYVVWRKSDGSPENYQVWRANFGRQQTGSGLSVGAVPEAGNFVYLAAAFLAAIGVVRRRSW